MENFKTTLNEAIANLQKFKTKVFVEMKFKRFLKTISIYGYGCTEEGNQKKNFFLKVFMHIPAYVSPAQIHSRKRDYIGRTKLNALTLLNRMSCLHYNFW